VQQYSLELAFLEIGGIEVPVFDEPIVAGVYLNGD
jgi:hypothetical protein